MLNHSKNLFSSPFLEHPLNAFTNLQSIYPAISADDWGFLILKISENVSSFILLNYSIVSSLMSWEERISESYSDNFTYYELTKLDLLFWLN